MKVLHVDDSDEMRAMLRRFVAPITGITELLEARTVAEALSCLRENQPEVTILDLRLPDGTALDFLKQAADEGLSATHIVLTNFDSKYARRASRQAGAHFFYNKATEFNQLYELLARLAQMK